MSLPPILCYHKVDARRELGVTRLAPRVFRRQMEALARAGARTLGSAELERLATEPAAGAPPSSLVPSRSSLVLTFDDGYAALAEHAFPVLAELGLKALVFVVTDYVGGENRWDVALGGRRFRHLSWDQLGDWRSRGVIEVHSHGATHARLTWLADAQLDEELARSRQAVAERIGEAPAAVCYPFAAADARVVGRARAAGYRLGFAGPRPVTGLAPADAALALARRPVYAWDGAEVPLVLRSGLPGRTAMAAARFASRLSVTTSLLRRPPRRV